MSDKERWFDGDYSETYLGLGHQDRSEFAAFVTSLEYDMDPLAETVDPSQIEHLWAHGEDGPASERFNFCDESREGAFPITSYRP